MHNPVENYRDLAKLGVIWYPNIYISDCYKSPEFSKWNCILILFTTTKCKNDQFDVQMLAFIFFLKC